MTIRRKAVYATATVIGTAALTAALATPALATIIGTGTGQGTTAIAAEDAATLQLHEDYFGCGPVTLISDTEGSNGIWSAKVGANCKGLI